MDLISAPASNARPRLAPSVARLLLTAIIGLLAACASHPPSAPPTPAVSELSKIQVPTLPSDLDRALSTLPSATDQRQAYIFSWTDQALKAHRINYANSLLQLLEPSQLSANKRLRWVSLAARVALAQKDPTTTIQWLDNQQLNIPQLIDQANAPTRGKIQLLRATAWAQQNKLLKSLKQRIAAAPQLDNATRLRNDKAIWSLLMQLPGQQLTRVQAHAKGNLLGWLQLAAIYRNPTAAITQQAQQIADWRQHWPAHPANLHPPAAIQVLEQATRFRPRKVAILLPQTGPLAKPAKAIRDGLLTAYYQAKQDQQRPQLLFLNSANGDIGQLYQQAVRQGAQFVLGPLSKQRVADLAKLGQFNVPVVSFNYSHDNQAALPANFYEYGLAPEDQAAQIAAVNWREGKRRAAILYTQSNWGKRVAKAFRADWQKRGGKIVADMAFDNNISKVVPELLQTDASHQREHQLRHYTRMALKFQEHPRQDIDFLLLLATPNQGRQIKPLLNFHFAARLPVVALSYIYTGKSQPVKNRDLDGIHFLDIPWILDASNPLHDRIQKLWPDKHGMYQSLFAMGLDAYHLIDHLPLLMASPDMRLPGATGALSLRGNQRIRRYLDWGVFKHGEAQLQPLFAPAESQ